MLHEDDSPSTGSKENHRKREKGVLVYPVYSRRSGGLSVGINLFPDKKHCNFDCPYCEVFPFSCDAEFSTEQMEADLRDAIAVALDRNIPVKDICFSGNGEPTLSPFFPEALEIAGHVRMELVPEANLVLITNGTGLLEERLFSLLREAAFSSGLDIWLKLDAGTPEWYKKMNRSNLPYNEIIEAIKKFVACAPVTIQTMLCVVDGESPSSEEAISWEKLILELLAIADRSAVKGRVGIREPAPRSGRTEIPLRKVQIYGKARPAPEDPIAGALPAEYLEARAASLRAALAKVCAAAPPEGNTAAGGAMGIAPNVEVYP